MNNSRPLLDRYLRHLQDRNLVIVSRPEDADAVRGEVEASGFSGACRIVSPTAIPELSDNVDAVLLALPSLDEARAAHAACARIKSAGIPVVFAQSRDIFTQMPTQFGMGISYSGMFRIVRNMIPVRDLPAKPTYAEFGVFDGRTFSLAYHTFRPIVEHFVAVDSFEGIRGARDAESAFFANGDYFANEETFRLNMDVAGVDLDRVSVVKGDFCALPASRLDCIADGSVVIGHIDCDVHRPALAALELLSTKLHDHAVLLFDDYDTMWASNDLGERAAVRDWLARHANFELTEYRSYAAVGRAFLFHRKT